MPDINKKLRLHAASDALLELTAPTAEEWERRAVAKLTGSGGTSVHYGRQLSREYKPGEKFDNIDRLPFEDELESYLACRALVLVGRSDYEDLLAAQEELRRRVEEYDSLEAAVNAGLIKTGDWSGATPPFDQQTWGQEAAGTTIEGARDDWAPKRAEVGFEEQYGEEFERR